ncbi:Mu transposase C-terminal domain-containing protein [Xanthomonas sp. AmX2]|uniref:Mu transposase C-terminal domain-containing protein n=1 Tax=Xanthomonas sp. TaxID=29446 RepID=UPI00197EF90A|nr:Mu transposase C-terminal domain-containing protein [Xanthomonas sp.]MBN6150172.1 Mu transposase C-terminal domain-containing protein [Xanthomonas sp.]
MTSNLNFNRRTLPQELANCDEWPPCDTSQLDPADLALFERRRKGLVAYLSGRPTAEIASLFGIETSELLRYLNRCIAVMNDGRIAGWAGLLKGFRKQKPTRSKPVCAMPRQSFGGYTGALSALFVSHPNVQIALDMYLATGIGPDGAKEGRVSKKKAHEIFLELCRRAGLGSNAWPFCVSRRGREAIAEYVKHFLTLHHEKVSFLQYGEECKQRSRRPGSRPESPTAVAPFEIVEADEHTADIIFTVGVRTPKGTKYVPSHRMTLILVVDRFTNYILGWDIVVRRQIAKYDFLRCIDHAAAGQCLSEEIRHALEGTLATAVEMSELRLGFGSLFVDNALAHLSDCVGDRVRAETGAAISFGAIKQPQRRSVVERVFGWMAANVFHRSPSTTGNSPVDTRRNHPELQAVRNKVTLEQVMEATSIAVARWNSKPTEANYGSSPAAQMLEYYAPGSGCLAPLGPPRSTLVPRLRVEVTAATVRGSQKKGRLPRVCYSSVEYGSPILAARWDLIGQAITIHADPYDISHIHVYTRDGRELGNLVPLDSRWRHPHSIEIRRLLKSKIMNARDEPDTNVASEELGKLAQKALDACVNSPRSTQAATFLAEEGRKGYAPEASSEPSGKRPNTKTLASRVRTSRNIDFTVIGK